MISRDDLAEALCPPSHREGFGGIIYDANGTSRSVGSGRQPCLQHVSQADALLASGALSIAEPIDTGGVHWTCPYCDDPLIDHPKPECTERRAR